MNICVINVDSNPQYIGGIKRVCVTLSKKWEEWGHKVIFICLCDNELKYDNVAGLPQLQLPDTKDEESQDNRDFLVNVIKTEQIDIILNPFMDCKEISRLCFAVSKQTNAKLVSAWHFSPTHFTDIVDQSFFIRLKLGNPIKRYFIDSLLWLKWRLYKRKQVTQDWSSFFKECTTNCDKVVFLSNRFLPLVEKMMGAASSDKIMAISNPVSFSYEKVIDYSCKKKTILWVGRLGYDMKRLDKMLNIWKMIYINHPNWKLIICGSGDSSYFKKLCESNNIGNVEFTGFVDVKAYYKEASILCNTSVTEGWGLNLVEATEYGCVPMAFDSYASVHDIITDGENGFIIPAFNETLYAQKLEILMNNTELRQRLAGHGRNALSRFDQDIIAKQWIDLFNNLLNL